MRKAFRILPAAFLAAAFYVPVALAADITASPLSFSATRWGFGPQADEYLAFGKEKDICLTRSGGPTLTAHDFQSLPPDALTIADGPGCLNNGISLHIHSSLHNACYGQALIVPRAPIPGFQKIVHILRPLSISSHLTDSKDPLGLPVEITSGHPYTGVYTCSQYQEGFAPGAFTIWGIQIHAETDGSGQEAVYDGLFLDERLKYITNECRFGDLSQVSGEINQSNRYGANALIDRNGFCAAQPDTRNDVIAINTNILKTCMSMVQQIASIGSCPMSAPPSYIKYSFSQISTLDFQVSRTDPESSSPILAKSQQGP